MVETQIAEPPSVQAGLINIDTLLQLSINLNLKSSTQDKLREIFEILSKQANIVAIPMDRLIDLISKVIELNRCTEYRVNRFFKFERRVYKTTHLV